MPSETLLHLSTFRVYYEDTDAGGIVYYANYLRFAERARTEWLRSFGYDQSDLRATHNLLFAVRRVTVDYQAPARLDDMLEITTELTRLGGAALDMRQIIRHEGKTLAEVTVTLVAITPEGKVLRIPDGVRIKLCALNESG